MHQGVSRFIGKLLCILAIIQLMGGTSVVMQSIAWTSMLKDRIPEQGIEQAINTTFSGEYPCEKCIALALAKAAKNKRDHQESPLPELRSLAKHISSDKVDRLPSLYPPSSNILPVIWPSDKTVHLATREVATPPPDAVV